MVEARQNYHSTCFAGDTPEGVQLTLSHVGDQVYKPYLFDHAHFNEKIPIYSCLE